jgi:hypothetical protein
VKTKMLRNCTERNEDSISKESSPWKYRGNCADHDRTKTQLQFGRKDHYIEIFLSGAIIAQG